MLQLLLSSVPSKALLLLLISFYTALAAVLHGFSSEFIATRTKQRMRTRRSPPPTTVCSCSQGSSGHVLASFERGQAHLKR